MAWFDGGEGAVFEGGEDEAADDRSVAVPGRGGQVDPGLLDCGVPLAEGDAGPSWVGPLAAQHVGLHGGEERLGVDPPGEIARPFAAVGCPVAGLPGAGVGLADVRHVVSPNTWLRLRFRCTQDTSSVSTL